MYACSVIGSAWLYCVCLCVCVCVCACVRVCVRDNGHLSVCVVNRERRGEVSVVLWHFHLNIDAACVHVRVYLSE